MVKSRTQTPRQVCSPRDGVQRRTRDVKRLCALTTWVLLMAPGLGLAEDLAKQVDVGSIGFLHVARTGELTTVFFAVSHRLEHPVTAIVFRLTFLSPERAVLHSQRYRHEFQYLVLNAPLGSPLPRDEVRQVTLSPSVQGFCPGTCGTIQVRVLQVETEL
jgi:hypothetical protein